LNVEIKKAIAI